MEPLQTLGAAYENLRNTMDILASKLGDDGFARSVVTVGARNALQEVMPRAWERGYSVHAFCEALQATQEHMMAAALLLERIFALRDKPAEFIGSLGKGQLAVRGNALYFETDSAASMFAHAFTPYGQQDRWTTAMTKDAEIYLTENKMNRPSVSVSHSKTEESAMKTLVRIGFQHFGVKLERA